MGKNIFFTGNPGIGKTTVIKRIVTKIRFAGGFYTEEIREGSVRKGFKIINLEGKEGILASKEIASRYRVGKYGVNISDLEQIGVKSILDALKNNEKRLIVIDEIGKMELFSVRFQDAVIKALESKKKVLGTIPVKTIPFIERIKVKTPVDIILVTIQNRDSLPDEILSRILSQS